MIQKHLESSLGVIEAVQNIQDTIDKMPFSKSKVRVSVRAEILMETAQKNLSESGMLYDRILDFSMSCI